MPTVVTPRVKKGIVKSPNLEQNALSVFVELDKLVDYYEAEIKQAKIRIKNTKDEYFIAKLEGMMMAYADHMAEISYIKDILRDLDKEE